MIVDYINSMGMISVTDPVATFPLKQQTVKYRTSAFSAR